MSRVRASGSIAIYTFAFLGLMGVLVAALQARQSADGDPKIAQAPEKARTLTNPFAADRNAIEAGRKLYVRYCASCHGAAARGLRKAPDLRGPVVQQATPGALFWFLKNGDMKQGMPSWSRLPDQQLWQLVTYLQSLR